MIYHTGYNDSGQRIETEYCPRWLYMHGGNCVNCHGTGGKGISLDDGSVVPPDIRYETLTS